jgi:tetratricopeptide (TPR) repeat protein
VTLALLAALGVTTLVLAQDSDKIEPHKPLPSTALVLAYGEKFGIQGSGFLVDRGERLLLTNEHVAKVEQKVEVMFPMTADDGRILANRDLYFKKAPRIRGVCVGSNADRDLALIKLASVPNLVPEVKLAGKMLKVGDRTHLLGNPAKDPQVWVYGFGKVKEVGPAVLTFGPKDKVEATIMVLTTEDRKIGPGASGGPVVNDQGELVGVIQSGAPDARKINCIETAEVRVFLGSYYRFLGTTALEKKDYNEAIAKCTKAVDINPADAVAYNERAVAYAFQRRQEEAIADYTSAVKLDPKLARAWRGRGTAHYMLGKYEQAVADASEAIKVDPKYAQAHLSRSRAYQKLGKSAEAKADYETAVKLDPALKQ